MRWPIALLGAAMLLLASAAEAADYYVAPSGDDGASGTSAAPFATIQHAADVVSPGDTVIVRDGTYTDTDGDDEVVWLRRGGTAAGWVTFRSEHPGGAVVDGQDNATHYCFDFASGANYVVIEGFEVKGCARSGFSCNSAEHHVVLRGNEVHHIGRRCLEADDDGGVGVYQGPDTSDHTYDGNVFHHIGRLHASDGCPYPDGFIYDWNHDHGIYIGDGTNTLIVNNVFYADDSGWGVQLWGYDLTQNVVVAHNTFVGATLPATPDWRVGTMVLGGNVVDLVIDNNVFLDPLEVAIFDYCVPGPMTLRNNVTTAAGMLMDPTCAATTLADNLLGSDPGLVDPAGLDFHLRANSPAIDRGLAHPDVPRDFDGNARPQGAGYDPGAFEFVSAAADAGTDAGWGADAAGPADASAPPDAAPGLDAGAPADAGPVEPGTDAGSSSDAEAPGTDAGAPADTAGASPDAAPAGADSGASAFDAAANLGDGGSGSNGAVVSGCGCGTAGGEAGLGGLLFVLALASGARRRR